MGGEKRKNETMAAFVPRWCFIAGSFFCVCVKSVMVWWRMEITAGIISLMTQDEAIKALNEGISHFRNEILQGGAAATSASLSAKIALRALLSCALFHSFVFHSLSLSLSPSFFLPFSICLWLTLTFLFHSLSLCFILGLIKINAESSGPPGGDCTDWVIC